jgi:hypothetical protein
MVKNLLVRFSQQLTVVAMVIMAVVAVTLAVSFFPWGRSIVWNVSHTLSIAGGFAVAVIGVLAMFVIPVLSPFFFRGMVVQTVDDKVEPDEELGFLSHVLIAVAFGAVNAVLTMLLFYGVWQHGGAQALLNTFGQLHPEEVPPFGWAIYGWVMFIIGYALYGADFDAV